MKEVFAQLKKYRYWILTGIIVIAMLYSVFNRNKKTPVVSNSPTPPSSQAVSSPDVTNSPIASNSSSPVSTVTPFISPSPTIAASDSYNLKGSFADLDETGQFIFYLDPYAQEFKKLDLTTRLATTVGTVPAYLDFAQWSPNHEKLFVVIRNSQSQGRSNPLYDSRLANDTSIPGMYDLKTSRLTKFNTNIRALSFLGNDHIMYQFKESSQNNLAIANIDGSRWRNITALGNENTSIMWAGQTALVLSINSQKVTRYDTTGKALETYTLPEDLRFSQSIWASSGQNAVYWVKENNEVLIKRVKSSGVETVTRIPSNEDDLAILWDNKKGDIYLVTFETIQRVGSSPL